MAIRTRISPQTEPSVRAKWIEWVLNSVLAALICALLLMAVLSIVGWRVTESPKKISWEIDRCFLMEVGFPDGHWQKILETRPQDIDGISRLELFENGTPLGPSNCLHDDIRSKGKGRFSHWGHLVYFASSDNSDPTNNGRSYRIQYPIFVRYRTVLFFALLVIAVSYVRSRLLGIAWPPRRLLDVQHALIDRRDSKITLLVAWGLFIVPFLIVFLPYLLYYFLPLYQYDSSHYCAILYQISQRKLPNLLVAPGYPLIVASLVTLTGALGAIPVAQILFLLGATLFLIYEVHRSYGWVCIPVSLAMIGFVSDSSALIDAASIVTESTYTSGLILIVALLFLSVRKDSLRYYLLLVLSIGIVILIRPAGLFLLGSLLALLCFLRAGGKPLKYLLLVPTPAAALLAGTMCYNYAVTGQPSISPFHALSLPGSVALFWKQDAGLSDQFSRAIQSYHSRVPPKDLELVQQSWDLDKLYHVFANHVSPSLHHLATEINLWEHADKGCADGITSPDGFRKISDEVTKMAVLAIVSSPKSYVKLVVANTYAWFKNISYRIDPYAEMRKIFWRLYVDKSGGASPVKPLSLFVGSYYQTLSAPNFRPHDDDTVTITPTVLQKLHVIILNIVNPIFSNMFWVWSFLIITFISCAQWIRTGFSRRHFFLMAFITTIPLGAAAVVSLGAVSLVRYSYPTQFVYYLSVALVPILLGVRRNSAGAKDNPVQP